MKKVLFYGHGGAYNHGAEAIVRTTVASLPASNKSILLSTHFPEQDKEFHLDQLVDRLIPADFSQLQNEKSANTLQEKEFWAKEIYRDALSIIDAETACIGIGGDNYCYSNWHRQATFHKQAKKMGAKSFLWCCSIQPEMINDSMEAVLKEHDQIFVRESETLQALQEHKLENATLIPDPAFTLPLQKVEIPQTLLDGTLAGINLSPLVLRRSPALMDDFIKAVKFLLEHVDHIVFIPHVTMPADNDKEAFSSIQSLLAPEDAKKLWMPEQSLNASELKYIISKCEILLCSRTHASIAGYSTFVPTLVLGYSVKSKGIGKDLNMGHFVLPIENSYLLPGLTTELWDNRASIRNELASFIPDYQARYSFPSIL